MTVRIERAGFLITVQDLGRGGHRASGVSVGGALDSHALRIANLLVGNEETAAGLELTLGLVRLRFTHNRLVAWSGGPFDVQVEGRPLRSGRPALVSGEGELIAVAPAKGARGWLAISGGIEVPLVLGSRSTDLRSGFGGFSGRALRDGDILELGQAPARARRIAALLSGSARASWTAPNEWTNTRKRNSILRIVPGAEWVQFDPTALIGRAFIVSPESDRMGVRLEGAQLSRLSDEELLSEAVAPGTIQVPPSGEPILLLEDCQTIGGYPKIGHVITVDLPAAAQLRPGDSVRFAEVSLGEAQRLTLQRERDLERFRVGLSLRTV